MLFLVEYNIGGRFLVLLSIEVEGMFILNILLLRIIEDNNFFFLWFLFLGVDIVVVEGSVGFCLIFEGVFFLELGVLLLL